MLISQSPHWSEAKTNLFEYSLKFIRVRKHKGEDQLAPLGALPLSALSPLSDIGMRGANFKMQILDTGM